MAFSEPLGCLAFRILILNPFFLYSSAKQAQDQVQFGHVIVHVSPPIGLQCKHRLKWPGISRCKSCLKRPRFRDLVSLSSTVHHFTTKLQILHEFTQYAPKLYQLFRGPIQGCRLSQLCWHQLRLLLALKVPRWVTVKKLLFRDICLQDSVF